MWDRWLQGDSLHAIARLRDRGQSSLPRMLVEMGGARLPRRKRSMLALASSEREVISRGAVSGRSIRTIATHEFRFQHFQKRLRPPVRP